MKNRYLTVSPISFWLLYMYLFLVDFSIVRVPRITFDFVGVPCICSEDIYIYLYIYKKALKM